MLGSDNGIAGAPVMLWDCLRSAKDMHWTHFADGTLRTLGRCLDAPSGNTANGTRLQLWNCNGLAAQKFHLP